MVSPISSLANMEMQLYGGFGTHSAAPSYLNGYNYSSSNSLFSNNPSFMGNNDYQNYYNNPNMNFGQQIPAQYTNQNQVGTNTAFNGLSKDQVNAITDYYAKNLEPSESLSGAITSGVAFGALMMNPRIIAHPWNSLTSFSDVNEIFKGARKEGSAINKLWKENSYIMEEAYAETQRLTARYKSKLGLFRKRYSDTEYKQLKEIMEKAVKTGDMNKIAEATETLKHAYVNNGHIPNLWNKIRGKETATVAARIKDSKTIANNVKELFSYSNMDLKKAFKKTGGWIGLAFGALEIIMNLNKITSAFAKDKENAENGIKTNYGKKQTSQTVVKATGNAVGWAVGETLGVLAAAKYGAKIGTKCGGLVGTVIGSVAGIALASIGMWIAGKGTRAIMGDDVANKIEAEKLLATEEGQQELLLDVAQSIQKDKKADMKTINAVSSAISMYA